MSESVLWNDAVPQVPLGEQAVNQDILRRRYARWTLFMSLANACFTILLVSLTLSLSDTWWLTGSILSLPLLPWAIPSICLLVCALIWNIKVVLINATCLGVILCALCGFCFSVRPFIPVVDSPRDVRVSTCRVFEPKAGQVEILDTIASHRPDVLVLSGNSLPRLKENVEYRKWHSVVANGCLIASRWPVSEVVNGTPSCFEKRITAPFGVFTLTVCREPKDLIASDHGAHVVVCQFRGTVQNRSIEDRLRGWTDTFRAAGIGFGYTSPCDGSSILTTIPYQRSDLILSNSAWQPIRCVVDKAGRRNERFLIAQLRLRE